MESPSPAPSSPAPAPSAPPSAPASTPAPSSPPSTPAKYGEVPKSKAQELWAKFDADAATKTPGEQAAPPEGITVDQIPEAKPPEQAAPEAPAAVDPQASPNEATLPPKLREHLKSITDPKARAYLADSAHMRATISRTGLPFAQLNQFISEAPQYLQKAPTLDVLNQIAQTAEEANSIGADFLSGAEDGHARFSQKLLSAGPVPFVQYLGFLFNNTDYMIGALRQNFGEALGAQVEQFRDNLMDRGISNVVARMRAGQKEADEAGKESVLGEVADELEKFVGLKERSEARTARPRVDPRDLRIQTLEQQNQQALVQQREQFTSGIFQQAGNVIDKSIVDIVTKKASGFTQEAKNECIEAIGNQLYSQLLTNKNVVARVNAIDQTGRWDAAHSKQRIDFYTSAAERLIGVIATPILQRMAQITGAGRVARQQKVAAQIERRDPGASGSPPRERIPMPTGRDPKELFAYLDKQAEARGAG
jgi:hypothetical protein